MPLQEAQQSRWKRFVTILRQLNVYDSETTDPVLLRQEIISTRLFIVFMIISTYNITIYATANYQKKTERVSFPTESQYRKLFEVYPNALTCPCSTISIPFNEFSLISPVFHQVCESAFVSQEWIDFTFHPNRSTLWPMDIRNSLSAVWQIIRVFCEESKATFDNSLADFEDSPLISSFVLSQELLDIELKVAVNTLQQTAVDSLLRSSKAVHSLTRVSEFMTGVSMNLIAVSRIPNTTFEDVIFRTMLYKNYGANEFCHCQSDESCPIPAGIYHSDTWETFGSFNLNEIVPDEIIPGLVLDCLPMQTILSSSLECFYNNTCLNTLFSAYPNHFNITPLNVDLQSHFQPTDQIERLIDAIFIEDISSQTNFTSYFHHCEPHYCVYTYSKRFDWSYVFTTVIGLVGGLNIGLRLICQYFIALIFWCRKRASSNESQVEPPAPRASLIVLYQRLMLSIYDTVVQLNLFTKNSRRPIQLRRGVISTRLYLLLFAVILTGLTLYTAVSVRSVTQTSRFPSETQYKYLQKKYPNTISCPCSTVLISYEKIIDIRPSLHQVCSSDFVKVSWYKKLGVIRAFYFHGNGTKSFSWYFRTLAAFCELSRLLLDQSIRRFNSIGYIIPKVITPESFESQMENIISGFKLRTKNEFNYTIALIQTIFRANQYPSGLVEMGPGLHVTNFSLIPTPEPSPVAIVAVDSRYYHPETGLCYCGREGECFQERNYQYNFAGICSPLRAVAMSSLKSLYEENFVAAFELLINREHIEFLRNISHLDPTKPSRFSINTTLDRIIEELMVEDWNSQVNFSRFYEICSPESCSYSYNEPPSLILLISIVSGIVGGLNILLRLICPVMIRILIADHSNNRVDSSTNMNQDPSSSVSHSQGTLRQIRQAVTSLNLFDDKPTIVDTKQKKVLTTWLFLALLISTMVVTTFYISLISYSSNTVVRISSFSKYKKLSGLGLNSFRCPCTEISVPYKDFVSIEATFHQVCDSDLIEKPWIYGLFLDSTWELYNIADIRSRGTIYFSLLSGLCKLVRTTISNALNRFLEETLVNTVMLSESEFHSQVNASIDLFERNTPVEFATVLRILNRLTHASTFASALMLNWEWEPPTQSTFQSLKAHAVEHRQECSCGTRNDCIKKGGLYEYAADSPFWLIPGFFVGCSSIETVLRSTLECFYNRSCIYTLLSHGAVAAQWMNTLLTNMTALDPDLDSRFQQNTSMREMIELLFVEKWQKNVYFETFYNKCAPIQCSYSYETRNEILYIATTMLSIYGGSTAVLRLVVPYFVSLVMCFVHRRTATVEPPT